MKFIFKKIILKLLFLMAGSLAVSGLCRVFAETDSCLENFKEKELVEVISEDELQETENQISVFNFVNNSGEETGDKLFLDYENSGEKIETVCLFKIPVDESLQALNDHEDGNLKAKFINNDDEIFEIPISKENRLLCFNVAKSKILGGSYDIAIYDGDEFLGTFKKIII